MTGPGAGGGGRVAIVTGAAGGIGTAIADRLIADGWRIAAADIDEEALARLAVRGLGGTSSLQTFPVDVADERSVAAMVKAVHDTFGRIDGLVNNAGVVGSRLRIWEIPDGEWERIIAVDLASVYYCSRAAVVFMLRRGWGRIVNISSIAGKEGNPSAAAYSAAKAGVIGLTKSMGKELATQGILVNCITPAEIETPLLGALETSEVDRWLSRIPMGRMGQPAEVANMVAWLLSDKCSFSTSGVFDISGGRSTY